MSSVPTKSEPPKRRRGEALVAALRQAVMAELREHGYGGVSFAGVARRAETSRPVVHRQYRSRAHMVADAVAALGALPLLPDEGTLRQDLCRLLSEVIRASVELGPEVTRALMGEADEALLAELLSNQRVPAKAALDQVVAAARRRGELGPGPIPEVALMTPVAVLQQGALERVLSSHDVDVTVDEVALPLYRAVSQG